MHPGFRLICVCVLGWWGRLICSSHVMKVCWLVCLKTTRGSRFLPSMARIWKLRPREVG